MGVKIIVATSMGEVLAVLQYAQLDIAFGDGENDFEFSYADILPKDTIITPSCLWFVPDSEIGGVIDNVRDDCGVLTFTGRSWHGILHASIIQPDAGKDYKVTTSESLARSVSNLLISQGLSGLFSASDIDTRIKIKPFQFARYVSLYEGLRVLFKTYGYTLGFSWDSRSKRVKIINNPLTHFNGVENITSLTATSFTRPVNHMIGLGSGELKNRLITHLYADIHGKVSTRQSLYGVDEVCAVYDANNIDSIDKLTIQTQAKLEKLQKFTQAKMKFTDPDNSLHVDDTVTAFSHVLNVSLTLPVSKKIVTLKDGVLSASYELETSTTS